MSVTQVRNPEQVDLLRADFQYRYEPNFAWKSMASCLLALPVLRGAWLASVNSAGNWYDLSGLGKTLTLNGNPTFNYDGLVPYWDLDGTGDCFIRADEADLDITGTETYVAAAAQGLTLGGWFWWDVLDTVNGDGLMWKSDLANQRAWELLFDSIAITLRISQNGAAMTTVSSTVAAATGAWYFVVGRFFPNVGLYITVNGTTDSNLAAPPASIWNSNQSFCVGIADAIAATALDGRIACCFLCAAALSDALVSSLFNQTRAAFGV